MASLSLQQLRGLPLELGAQLVVDPAQVVPSHDMCRSEDVAGERYYAGICKSTGQFFGLQHYVFNSLYRGA